MEGFQELEDYATEPLSKVELEFSSTKVSHSVLSQYLKLLCKSRTVEELHNNIADSAVFLNALDTFSSCFVEVLPGSIPDSAKVSFDLQDSKRWGVGFGTNSNSEGGSFSMSASLKNLRGKADLSITEVEYSPRSKTFGYSINHYDRMFVPLKWESLYTFQNSHKKLTQNVAENLWGGSLAFVSSDGVNSIKLGSFSRTNKIAVEHASLELLKEIFPVSTKNFVSYKYTYDTVEDEEEPRAGHTLEILNELAFSKDTQFHRLEVAGRKFYSLTENLVLKGSCNLGVIVPWAFTSSHINDRYIGKYKKGFSSYGGRAPPADQNLRGKFQPEGDDLGKMSELNFEGKLQFYNTPLLSAIGVVPFIYGNLLCAEPHKCSSPKSYLKDYGRGSIGFGLDWKTSLGTVEFSYSAKTFKKPQDVSAEFQVIFSD